MAEISTLQKASVYNQVYPLQKTDYAKEVTDASADTYVLVNLTSSTGGNTESRVLSEIWRQLAPKYGELKFCEIRGDMCIEGYPDRNTPTILVYKDGEIRRQYVTLRDLKGVRTKAEGLSPPIREDNHILTSSADVEKVLVDLGAIKEGDLRLRKEDESEDDRRAPEKEDDDDDDWD